MSEERRGKLPGVPILIKQSPEIQWDRSQPVFYVLARNSLMICRNHPFFRSCVPARTWPPGLEHQESFLEPKFPMLSRKLFEQVVGFFDWAAKTHGAEAAALLVWDRKRDRAGVLVPKQEATVLKTWSGGFHPIGLEYFPPTDQGPDLVTFGDIHSHAALDAYSSSQDVGDENYRAGIHVVVGRLGEEPPQIHVEAVADGVRFPLSRYDVLGGYQRRRPDYPPSWREKLTAKERSSFLKPLKSGG